MVESTLTIPRLKAYREYWKYHPATNDIGLGIACLLGYKPPTKEGKVIEAVNLPDIEE